jgi:hypothetical protein
MFIDMLDHVPGLGDRERTKLRQALYGYLRQLI